MARMTKSHKKKVESTNAAGLVLSNVEEERQPTFEQEEKLSYKVDLLKVLEAAEENPPMVRPERVLRPRTEPGKKPMEYDEHGQKVVDSLLSLHHVQESVRSTGFTERGFPQPLIETLGASQAAGQQMNSLQKADPVQSLKAYIQERGGVLEEGWKVEIQKRSNSSKVNKTYISPAGEKFRSRVEVERHLHLDSKSLHVHSRTASMNREQRDELGATILGRNNYNLEGIMIDSNGDLTHHRNEGSRTHLGRKDSAGRGKNPGTPTLQEGGLDGVSLSCQRVAEDPATPSKQTGSDGILLLGKELPTTTLITDRCRDVLRSIILTEKFGALSRILSGGSPPVSLDDTFQIKSPIFTSGTLDLQLISLRLSTGAYGESPEMFSRDMQQVWTDVCLVGNELVALANTLSEVSDDLYQKQVLSLFQTECEDRLVPSTVIPSNDASNLKQQSSPAKRDGHNGGPTRIQRLAKKASGEVSLTESTSGFERFSENCHGLESPSAGQEQPVAQTSSYELNPLSKGSPKRLRQQQSSELALKVAHVQEYFCKICGLKADTGCITCIHCKAMFHRCCLDPLSVTFPATWSCQSCASTNVTDYACTATRNIVSDVQAVSNFSQHSSEVRGEPEKATGVGRVCIACGKDGSIVLFCVSCNAACHMSCITPPVGDIPDNWYCPLHTEVDKRSAAPCENGHADGHDSPVSDQVGGGGPLAMTEVALPADAVICAEVTSSKPPIVSPESGHQQNQGVPQNTAQSLEPPSGSELPENAFILKDEDACKVCEEKKDKQSLVCCSGCNRRYHLSCLKPSLKKIPRGTWYCPSCLCRACMIDADDEKILLCDGCDEGYHTYCLHPPLVNIPEGAWFCPSCTELKGSAPRISTSSDDAEGSKKIWSEISKRKRKSTEPRRCT